MIFYAQQNFLPRKHYTNKKKTMWKMLVANKLTKHIMYGFFIESHGSLYHGKIKQIKFSDKFLLQLVHEVELIFLL